jgi:hypothetical protein
VVNRAMSKSLKKRTLEIMGYLEKAKKEKKMFK